MPRPMPAVEPPPGACLVTVQGAPVPLLGVEIVSEVFGAHAKVVLRQRYENLEKKPIEAIYTFPIPSDAALVGFVMECNGRRLEAEIKPREEAFAAYDDALSQGHGAALLDQERRNVFTAAVGNLLPGEETIIEVAYVQALRADEGALRFVVPTVVAPRYVPGVGAGNRTAPGSADPTDRVPDADRVTPRIADVAYGLSVDVLFDLARPVTIESPSHPVMISAESGDKQRVRLRGGDARLDRDLVLIAAGAPGVVAGVTADRRGEAGTFALTVVPDLFDPNEKPGARDVVFVVDTSGSMEGPSLHEARAALRLCLRQLGEGDRFQIIAFNSTFSTFKPKKVPFLQRTLEEADAFVAGLQAYGGTEMLEPLEAALAELRDGGSRPTDARIVVLLTDGQVANEAEILERIANVATDERIRFYTFGIGVAASDLLVNDLARRTRGAAEHIYPGERIDDKVTAQFARAIAARVAGVSLSFEGADVAELAPGDLPDLVDGEPWVVYGRYTSPGTGLAKLRGTSKGERFYLEVPLDLLADATRDGLAQLWARARIRDLEEAKLDGRRAVANEKRIVDLSVAHGVASKHASFVVVEKRSGDRLAKGQPEARAVPVSAPEGWGGAAVRPQPQMYGAPPRPAAGMPYGALGGPPPPPLGMGMPQPRAMRARASMPLAAGAPPAFGPPAPRSPGPIAQAFSRAKQAIFGEDDVTRTGDLGLAGAASELDMLGEVARSRPASASADPALGATFARQLASGLWEGEGGGDVAALMATARALARAFADGVDAAHAIYGAQVKKAIDAILALAPRLAGDASAERAVNAALLAAYLVASGRRQKESLRTLVRGSFAAITAELDSPDAARAKLAELTA